MCLIPIEWISVECKKNDNMDVVIPIIVTNIAAIFIIGVSTFGGRGDRNRHLYYSTPTEPTRTTALANSENVVLDDGRTKLMARIDEARSILDTPLPTGPIDTRTNTTPTSSFGSLLGSTTSEESALIKDTTPYFQPPPSSAVQQPTLSMYR